MKKLKTFIIFLCLMVPCFFVGCSNENKNIMSVPNALTVETGGKITFERVNNEEYYVILVNDMLINVFPNTNSNVELYSIGGIDYLEYDASKVFTLGESYAIKVKACSEKKKDSSYSESVSYKHTLPVDKPLNMQINGLTLTWDPVENASYYKVKVLTPSDKTDKDDSETIAELDLTEYQFSTNKFDFASILTNVGEYKFYINAVSYDNNYTNSGYTAKIVYSHKVTLDAPSAVKVHKVNERLTTSGQPVDNLHLVAVLDKNANAFTLTVNSVASKYELSEPNDAISLIDNVIDINLNKLLGNDFSELTQYQFTLQCNYTTANESEKFYNDSKVSEVVYYDNYAIISQPIVRVEYDMLNKINVVYWEQEDASEISNIAGYIVYLHTSSGVVSETVGTDVNSRILTSDITAVSVKALGKGNYISSVLSKTIPQYEEGNTLDITFNVEGSIINWNDVADYYLIELDNKILSLEEPNLDLTSLDLTLGQKELRVIVAVDGYIPLVKTYAFEYSIKLAVPNDCGFKTSNPYLLSFDSVNNAMGYYVYLNNEKVDQLYTTTVIDLSQYIIKIGEYKNYTVKVQAVADKYSGYKDSSLSEEMTISHTKVLDKPQFKKDAEGKDLPIEKRVESGVVSYYLSFYGVEYALSYEVMINFNKITIMNDNRTEPYERDVTDYLTEANSYTITVRAIPMGNNNIKPSEKNSCVYELRLQLDPVTNINCAKHEATYTLSFNLQTNAKEYSVRIIKVNDANYSNYLNGLGLKNIFKVAGSTDISKYVQEAGLYQVYVTAIADPSGGYYADSDESSEYAEINKKTTLATPKDIEFNNKSESEYLVRWAVDEESDYADYYVIRVTDPKGNVKEYTTPNATKVYNINDSYTVEGFYNIKIKAMITPNSANSTTHQSGGYSDTVIDNYTYTNEHDYKRYSVFMYGGKYDFYINNVQDLMYLLWYHVLYGIDTNGLKIYIATEEGKTVADAINALALEANENVLDNKDKIPQDTNIIWPSDCSTEEDKLKYLVGKLLDYYPEIKSISSLSCESIKSDTNTFKLNFVNALDGDKVIDSTINSTNSLTKDYGNKYNYLADSARRNASTFFAIDTRDYIDVTTTEQLLMAVQYGKRPHFVGDSAVAEKIYNNAKSVLLSIVNNTMSDYEKVVEIFDWLEYAIELNYYSDRDTSYQPASINDYGKRADYYLEGVFLDLKNEKVGNFDTEFYLGNVRGTSESYAKAFTLLCAIEGINVRKVNGSYTYEYSKNTYTIDHTWNKVYLELTEDDYGNKVGAWYALDLMLSDNEYISSEKILADKETVFINNGYGISSHRYFLVTDVYLDSIGIKEDSIIPNVNANTLYDYYANAKFSMTVEQIGAMLGKQTGYVDVDYNKNYVAGEYQKYDTKYEGYSSLQAFISNAILYANYQVNHVNAERLGMFEIKLDANDTAETDESVIKDMINSIMRDMNTLLIGNHDAQIVINTIKGENASTIYICTMKPLY